MRRLIRSGLVLGFVLSIGAGTAHAQPAAPVKAAVPPPKRQPPLLSPERHADGRVTFRFKAPEAKSIAVRGQWSKEKIALTKDEGGLWTVTAPSVAPGIWEYSFLVDGIEVVDSANAMIKPQRWPKVSILEIPATPAALTEFQDLPHGTVHIHHYRSKVSNTVRRFHVYTPPGYETKPGVKYPVMYLLHGYSDNDGSWTVHGRSNYILDNLIAQGKAQPMVMVMTDGHVQPPESTDKDVLAMIPDNTLAYEKDLLGDVMPLVEKIYRVKNDARNRALVGLSMGGNQSLQVGLNHSDVFSWVGGFSSAPPAEDKIKNALGDVQKLNKRLALLWIACGKDDFLLKKNEELVAMLTKAGVTHTWRLTEGSHAWPVWRTYLADLAQLLFVTQPKKKG